MLFKSLLALNLFEDENLQNHAGYVLPGENLEVTKLKTVKKGETSIKIGLTEKGWATLGTGEFYFADTEKCCICLDTQCDIQLTNCCSNVFHQECLEAQIKSKWPTKLINFRYLDCPLCHVPLKHIKLEKVLEEHREFEKKIGELRTVQLEKEPLENEKDEYAFFMCETCEKPFCGGKVDCARDQDLDKKKMICKDCEWNAPRSCKDHRCFIHGKNFAMFKCDSCCSIASWDCINNHYCDRCHRKAHHEKDFPCSGPGKCPLGIPHPPNHRAKHGTDYITGFVIGCIKCVDPEAKGDHNYSGTGDLIWDIEGKKDIKKLNKRDVINLFSYGAPKAFSLPTDFSPINPKASIEKLEKNPDGMEKFKDMLQKLKIPRRSVLNAMKLRGVKDAESKIREIEPVNIDSWLKKLSEGVSKDEIKQEMLLWDYNPEETFEKMKKKRQDYLEKYQKLLKAGVPRDAVFRKAKKDKLTLEEIAYIEKKFKEYKDAKTFEKKLVKYVKMLKLKLPDAAVIGKMRLDGIEESKLKDTFKKVLEKASEADLKKYIKMYKFKVPEAAIKGSNLNLTFTSRPLGFSVKAGTDNKGMFVQRVKDKKLLSLKVLKAGSEIVKVNQRNVKQMETDEIKKFLRDPKNFPLSVEFDAVRMRLDGVDQNLFSQVVEAVKESPVKQIGVKERINQFSNLKALYQQRSQNRKNRNQRPPPKRLPSKRRPRKKRPQRKQPARNRLIASIQKGAKLKKVHNPFVKAPVVKKVRKKKMKVKKRKMRLTKDGVDPKEFEQLFEPNDRVPEIQLGLNHTPEKKKNIPKELLKFAKMLKIGIPANAVRNKMKMDGIDEKRILEIEVAKSPNFSGG